MFVNTVNTCAQHVFDISLTVKKSVYLTGFWLILLFYSNGIQLDTEDKNGKNIH